MPDAGSQGGASSRANSPRVWLLTAYRAGDNTQVLALGEALGWPFEQKRFVYVRWESLVNWPFSSTLAGVDLTRSSPLGSPWPDLVITAGRRNEPIARWIRRSADRRVRLVHVGRPWARPSRWDLIVTTPQYRVPDAPNVLQNEAPLHRVTPERLAKEAAAWLPRFAALPRPLIAVLAGGNSGPYPFDARSGWRLGRRASALARDLGGSLLVTTSARTLPETVEALIAAIDVPNYLYRWTPDAADNPYFGFLAAADRIVVTADSVSMMAEACATGRPVLLYDTGEGVTSMRGEGSHGAGSGWNLLDRNQRKAFIYHQTMRLGPRRLTRDIRIVQRRLVESGRVSWLGDELPKGAPPPLRDLEHAVARVRALF
ncbi:MAG TPA: mitochondrial fission ELM1 family protein [Myxococcota bacterium]|nr:mitochondrial fission ELM1 family protein [Myxococcota bacterium]